MLLDTNVYISAFAFRSKQLTEMIEFIYSHHELVMARYVANEILRVTANSNHVQLPNVMEFLTLSRIVWFKDEVSLEAAPHIRDAKDLPILAAGIAVGVDILVSGDKDFAALDIDRPRIMTPREFIDEFMRK